MVLIGILLTLIYPVDAANDQGLKWGIKKGVRYEYTLNVTDTRLDNVLVDCHFILESDIPQIENNIALLREVMMVTDFSLTNGSVFHTINGDFRWIAIGNWSLLTELLPASISFYTGYSPGNSSYEVIDTDSSWGFLFTSDVEICDVPIEKWVHGWILHLEFSKVDGVLDYSFFQWLLSDSVANTTVEVIRTDTIYPSNPTLIIIAGGAVVSILVVSVTFMRKRKQRTV